MIILFTIINIFLSTLNISYDIVHDTVICYNALYERHITNNDGYETVICSYTKDESRFLLFLLPPKHISNTVACQAFGTEEIFCPPPREVIGNRRFVNNLVEDWWLYTSGIP